MPQPTKGPRLGGSPDHQKAMLANLATSLFTHGRIHTTRAKAERLRPYAERLITKAKRGDLHNRRIIGQQIRDKDVVHRLMAEIGPFFADRPGGYTRIVKTLPRKGDNAPMAIIELVNERTASAEASQATRVASNRGTSESGRPGSAATGAAATAATIAAAESDTSSEPDTSSESDTATDSATSSESDTAAEPASSSESDESSEPVEPSGLVRTSAATGTSEARDASDDADLTAVPDDMAENSAENAGLLDPEDDSDASAASDEQDDKS